MQELGSGFGTDAGNAGYVVGTVAHHAEQVDDLQGFVHVKLLPDLIGPQTSAGLPPRPGETFESCR